MWQSSVRKICPFSSIYLFIRFSIKQKNSAFVSKFQGNLLQSNSRKKSQHDRICTDIRSWDKRPHGENKKDALCGLLCAASSELASATRCLVLLSSWLQLAKAPRRPKPLPCARATWLLLYGITSFDDNWRSPGSNSRERSSFSQPSLWMHFFWARCLLAHS